MAEEFQESEIIFPDQEKTYFVNYREMEEHNHNHQHHVLVQENARVLCNTDKKAKKKKTKKSNSSMSVPVNIPSRVFKISDSDDFEEEYDGDEIVPPHVILGRRVERKMAFSVCTGYGRTLKGRDLSEVRNSILRMTGFLET